MAGNTRVLELLEEMLDSGKTTEEVCRDCPELVPEVRQRWQEFCRIDAEIVALLPGLATRPDAGATALAAGGLPQVPGYEVEAVLGRGGMGVVYRARHLALKRTVALKMLAASHSQPGERARFRAEAEAVARLQHPNIVQIHEIGEADGRPFIALEYVAGGSLAERLRGQLPAPRDAARLVAALAEAMHLAHSRNLVHRDLKPANVLLAPNPKSEIRNAKPTPGDTKEGPRPAEGPVSDFVAKVTDFGLVRQLDADSGQTFDGVVMGTPSYMAPEQAQGRARSAGPAADVYALGAILYECLTGRPPFAGATPLETLEQVRSREPAAPSSLNRQVPRDLETVCLKCLRKEPERRYSSAQELADDLGRFVRGEPVAARPVGAAERVWKWVGRRPAMAVAAFLAVLVVVLGGLGGSAAWLWRRAELAREGERRAREKTDSALQGERLAREQVEQARRGEQAANDKLEQVLYLRRIWLAGADWRENNLAGMERELLACPPRLRRWEWHYLEHLCHSERRGFRFETDCTVLALSPDGERLAASGADGIVRIWDVGSGEELLVLPKHPAPLTCVCFSPDGSRLATNFGRGTFNVWDARTGQLLVSLPQQAPVYAAVCFSPDNRTVVTACLGTAVRFWDAATGEVTRVLPDASPKSAATFLSFSPDGQLLAVVEGGGPVRVRDVDSGEELSALPRPPNAGPLVGLCFSPDGRRLATTWQRGAVRLSDPLSGREEPAAADHASLPEAVCFSPDGRFLATGAADRTVRIRDGRNGQPIRTLQGHTGAVRSLAFSADGQGLVSAARDGAVKVWDPSADQEVRILGTGADARELRFSPDGRRLGVVQAGRVYLWDVRTGARLPPLAAQDGSVLGMGFTAAGLRVVRPSAGQTGTVQDVETGRPPRPLGGTVYPFSPCSFSPDGRLLAQITQQEVRLWDADTGQFLRTIQGPSAGIRCVGFSPDSRFLAAGCILERTVHVWDVRTGEERFVLTGPSGRVHGVAFHPDGNRLAAIADDGTIRTWDLRSCQQVDVRTGDADELARGDGWLCWSPDGQRLAGQWGRGTVQLWDVSTGEEVLRLPGDGAPRLFPRICFSPDGRLLAGCHGGTVRLWRSDTGQE
jgi:WD40 repeat protein